MQYDVLPWNHGAGLCPVCDDASWLFVVSIGMGTFRRKPLRGFDVPSTLDLSLVYQIPTCAEHVLA